MFGILRPYPEARCIQPVNIELVVDPKKPVPVTEPEESPLNLSALSSALVLPRTIKPKPVKSQQFHAHFRHPRTPRRNNFPGR